MIARQPDNIRTLNYASGYDSGDHSDHLSSARFARDAAAKYYANSGTISGFEGYPINNLPPNLTPSEVLSKSAAFFAYTPYVRFSLFELFSSFSLLLSFPED